MGLFDRQREPVFLKSTSSAHLQLEQLEAVERERLPDDMKERLDREMKLVSLGIYGEQTIGFELKNSHIPMYVLHDLYLEDGALSAQIDYLIVTRTSVFVIECKNLYGNIEINAKGDFIRTVNWGKRQSKEGIYSPITQNNRHLELIKLIESKSKSNAIARALFEKSFQENYHSVVVLANPKTVLNDRYAKKEIKEQVIRADGLISYMKKAGGSRLARSDKEMEALANFYLGLHVARDIDYAAKYRAEYEGDALAEECSDNTEQVADKAIPAAAVLCPLCGAPMVLRKAQKGHNMGKQFWGCGTFPKCKGIVNV